MDTPRLATLDVDDWTLHDGEQAHREHPETFWIPPATARHDLTRGSEVKLMFEMRGVDEDGQVDSGVERMWVIVTERVGDRYLGLLDNQPLAYDPADPQVYLRAGAEVCFGPEHVIDIAEDPVPESVIAKAAAEAPGSRWPRR